MKKVGLFFLCCLIAVSLAAVVYAEDSPVAAGEKAVFTDFQSAIPKDKKITVDQFFEIWKKAMSDKAYRDSMYMIDVRSHPEFYAFHIQGTDHIHAGHMYTIPKKIPDPNALIYVF